MERRVHPLVETGPQSIRTKVLRFREGLIASASSLRRASTMSGVEMFVVVLCFP